MTKICEELIEISPELDFGYVCKGIALGFNRENQKKREALRNFTKAIKINPENYDAYFFRGALQFRMPRRQGLGIVRTACKDMSKAYFENHPFALDFVKKISLICKQNVISLLMNETFSTCNAILNTIDSRSKIGSN